MAIQQEQHSFKGMQRDLTVSKFSPEYYFDAHNIRITAREHNTLLSVTNEKGNREIRTIDANGNDVTILGHVLGYATIQNTVVIFTTEGKDSRDHIYKFDYNAEIDGGQFIGVDLLPTGEDNKGLNLRFEETAPIEAFGIYENEEIQKVYWVDGVNQPRMINLTTEDRNSWNETSFDFSPEIKLTDIMEVQVVEGASGVFSSGVIQYAFTYINRYGVETPVINTSGLNYVAFSDRGASPEDKVSCGFSISLKNLDTNFEYVRLYSVHRASIDGTPDARRIIDIVIPESGDVFYVDTNTVGDTIDASELLFKGAEDIVAGTMTNKDQVLFLGNIKTNRPIINPELKKVIRESKITFQSYPKAVNEAISGFYPYTNELKLGANDLKHFKRREWYRVGIQFQYKNGQWSEVVHIKDIKLDEQYLSTEFKDNKNGEWELYYYPLVTLSKFLMDKMYSEGYRRTRLAVVFPSETDREVVCQGMLCPTVFNVADRYNGTCFAQSSWFTRPFPAFKKPNTYDKGYEGWVFKEGDTKDNSVAGILTDTLYTEFNLLDPKDCKPHWYLTYLGVNPVQHGVLPEFRHMRKLPDCRHNNAELQCNFYDEVDDSIVYNGGYVDKTLSLEDLNIKIDHSKDVFMVDTSIITLHSPDIEFNDSIQNMESDDLKLRIVGLINLTSSASDLNIQTSTPPFSSIPVEGYGFYKEFSGVQNKSQYGGNIRMSNVSWIDSFYGDKNRNDGSGEVSTKYNITGYYVYPWHANRSLLNQSNIVSGKCDNYGDLKYGLLDKKKMSNIRFSAFNTLFKIAYEFDGLNKGEDTSRPGISGVRIWNSKEDTIIKIPAPKNSGLSDLIYKGNIDAIITPSLYNKEYSVTLYKYSKSNCTKPAEAVTSDIYDRSPSSTNPKSSDYPKINKINGYPIIKAAYGEEVADYHNIYTSFPLPLVKGKTISDSWCGDIDNTINSYGTDPIRMKYKSTPHAVIALNYLDSEGFFYQTALPGTQFKSISGYDGNLAGTYSYSNKSAFFWDPNIPNGKPKSSGTYYGIIDKSEYYSCLDPKVTADYPLLGYSYLYLGELYRDEENVPNRFGGNTEEAFAENTWYPQPEKLLLQPDMESLEQTIAATVGDTFYMRYDCLKTYPFTLEDQNSIVDIVSFKCETRINLDGRYDRNRGQTSNLVMTPENFNKMNLAYSQNDNFWTYRGLDTTKKILNNFPNGITWTLEKTPGADVDLWTQINLASIYYLSGEKGKVTSLNTFNNEIYAFQEHGLSHLLYNARVQIPASDGVPIEISNGTKMGGSIYLSEVIGCQNKWSIVESPMGLYFIDNDTNALYLFNGQIDNISDRMGFKQWIETHNDTEVWNPLYWKNFKSFYDKNNGDVYFTLDSTSLCYAEPISQFTSFMSYEEVPAMFNINKDFFSMKKFMKDGVLTAKMWKQFDGEYNMFYGVPKPYDITFISNSFPTADKIFNVLEFRSDSWSGDKLAERTFDTLEVWNEYQRGVSKLTNKPGFPSPLKRKFRIWRALIPRDGKNMRDRIRNTWAYMKLSKNDVTSNRDRMELHDATVHYFA